MISGPSTKTFLRQINIKHMGVFDIKGLLIPLTARCKRDFRDFFKETPAWDHAVSEVLRAKRDLFGHQKVQRHEIPQAKNAH